jgi:hypothetical protein
MLLPDAERLTPERARTIFYRVTGEDYSLSVRDGWSPLPGRPGPNTNRAQRDKCQPQIRQPIAD